MDKAIELPSHDINLDVRVGRDGVWINFQTENGLHASLNVNSLAEDRPGIIGRALREWCQERNEQAQQVAKDNGQFGVGA